MKLESRDNRKRLGFARFLKSFSYSFDGLKYAFQNEQSVSVMAIITVIATTLGIILKISAIEWIFIIFVIGIVLATELINTSIEATIDLLSPDFHPLAKVAKDTASASVFIYSIVSVFLAGIIFIPKIIDLIEVWL